VQYNSRYHWRRSSTNKEGVAMKTCVELRKSKDIIQMVANCIKIEAPMKAACCLFNISQQPIAHTDILLQKCIEL